MIEQELFKKQLLNLSLNFREINLQIYLHSISKGNNLTKEFILQHYFSKNGNLKPIKNSKFLSSFNKSAQDIYNIMFDVDTNKIFCSCGKHLKFLGYTYGYSQHCSRECAFKDIEYVKNRTIKTEQTNQAKYGCNRPSQNAEIKEKTKEKCLEKYGVDSTNKVDSVKKKKVDILLNKYGVVNVSQIEDVKNKKQDTCFKNHGVNNPLISKELRTRYFIENYGVDNAMKVLEISKKSKQTYIDRYGVTSSFSFPETREKCFQTNLEKFGFKHASQNEIIKSKIAETLTGRVAEFGQHSTQKHWIELENFNTEFINTTFIKKSVLDLNALCNYFNISYSTIWKYILPLNLNFSIIKSNKTKTQQDIFTYINGDVFNARNVIQNLEIDIIKNNFCIEYDGLMFHSYGISKYSMFNNAHKENKKYHLNKTELCEEKGYQLFHIFENEWLNEKKQNIWKSMLNNILGLSDKIFARKCIIKEIDTTTAKCFCVENHLQGYSNSSIKIGLFYEGNLVSLMTFGKPRYTSKYEYELIRFCSKLGVNVVGGASKLLKYFESTYKPTSLLSYANRRWSTGKLYHTLGFEFSHNTEPGYFYLDTKEFILYPRTQFQKHKLKNLKHYSEERTESEIMFLEGYRRIWDCGNKVFFKEYK